MIEYGRMFGDLKDYPIFRTLPKKAQERIRAKASWEHITPSLVIREYPMLWEEEERCQQNTKEKQRIS
jgi:hypothetical protein